MPETMISRTKKKKNNSIDFRSIDRSYRRQDLQVVVASGDGLGGEAAPARRAGAVRGEPPVYAQDVEPVSAHGEHPDPLPVEKVRQADGAPRRSGRLLLLPRRRAPRRGRRRRGDVGGHGQRGDVLALEPGAGAAVRDPADGVGHGPAGAPHHALEHRVEPQRAHQRAQHRRQDHHHVVVQRRRRRARRLGRGRGRDGAAVGHVGHPQRHAHG
jgi:hypothetical protein